MSLQDDPEFLEEYSRLIDSESVQHQDDINQQEFPHYIGMELGLPRGQDNELHFAKVKRQVVDEEGNPLGTPHKNPILDARKYEVEYLDGMTEVLAANAIAENMLAQVDDHGHRQLLIDEIVNHR